MSGANGDAGDEPTGSAMATAGSCEFVVRLAQALHQHGMACHHLESLIGRVAAQLRLDAHLLSLPTAFLASFAGPQLGSEHRAVILRLEPGSMDLSRQSQVTLLARAVAKGELCLASQRFAHGRCSGRTDAATAWRVVPLRKQ
jgi:uncharacterized membrane protein YjjP (DUF1212 family)